MTGGAEVTQTPLGGLVCFYRERQWDEASFALASDRGSSWLLIYRGDSTPSAPTMVSLAEITGLDELDDGMDKPALAGFQRLEIEVNRTVLCQAIWPSTFTDVLVSALLRTTEAAQRA